jgi:hypothetical protein
MFHYFTKQAEYLIVNWWVKISDFLLKRVY